jgi:hypothetical protein
MFKLRTTSKLGEGVHSKVVAPHSCGVQGCKLELDHISTLKLTEVLFPIYEFMALLSACLWGIMPCMSVILLRQSQSLFSELGFYGGKSKSLYGKEGHLGLTLIKFTDSPAGLKEAERLAEFLERQGHGRIGWSRAQASRSVDPDQNPLLFETDNRTGERKKILYGYLAISSDLVELDSDSRKRAFLKSGREFDPSD